MELLDYVLAIETALPKYTWESWKCFFRESSRPAPLYTRYAGARPLYPDTITKMTAFPFPGPETKTEHGTLAA